MAKVLVLDANASEIRTAECKELSDFYRELNADMFDIAVRRINGKPYDIYCDDIGLFRDHPIVSAVNSRGHAMLVGNLIFANHDAEGNTTSLNDEDIVLICRNIHPYYNGKGEHRLAVLCEY